MFEKPCRCAKQKKNFRLDIGPFFIDDCCIEAGYDELGNKAEPLLTPEELQRAETLEVVDHPELDKEEVLQEEVKPKKKRSYNRGGNIKKES